MAAEPSDAAKKEINDLLRVVRCDRAGDILWERLTDREREALAGNRVDEQGHNRNALDIWMQLHDVPLPHAIVESAYETGFLEPPKRDWLLRELGVGASGDPPLTEIELSWDNIKGHLTLNGEVIGEFRRRKNPTRPQQVLEAFETSAWGESVNAPPGWDSKQVYDTLSRLNSKLQKISFHALESGTKMRWVLE